MSLLRYNKAMKRMVIYGPLAAGKSSAVTLFDTAFLRRGFHTYALSLDEVGHEILDNPAVVTAIAKIWGPEVAPLSQGVNRDLLAQRVFAQPAELARLESITHPRIAERAAEYVEEALQQGFDIAIFETAFPPTRLADSAAIKDLFAGMACVCVTAPDDIRVERAIAAGITDVEARIAAQRQWKFDAPYCLDNCGDHAAFERAVYDVASQLLQEWDMADSDELEEFE